MEGVRIENLEESEKEIVLQISLERRTQICRHCGAETERVQVLSRVMRKYNSVTYEVGKAKAEQAVACSAWLPVSGPPVVRQGW